MSGNPQRKYVVFIEGETIDLCVPSREALAEGWADWFNDKATAKWLIRGVYPNYREHQEAFYEGLVAGSRLAFLICNKSCNNLIGVISLSNIDLIARSAEIAMVLPVGRKRHPLAALEAMARVTEHGFELLGLERIWAGQAYPGLARWNQKLEVLGYRTEGVVRRGLAKGRFVSDSVMISVLHDDYRHLVGSRGFWPGCETISQLLRHLPKVSLAERVIHAIRREQEAYAAELTGGTRA